MDGLLRVSPVDYANTESADSYALLGVRAGVRTDRGVGIFIEIRNVTNRRYASMMKPIADARLAGQDELRLFSPGEGRAFYGGVESPGFW